MERVRTPTNIQLPPAALACRPIRVSRVVNSVLFFMFDQLLSCAWNPPANGRWYLRSLFETMAFFF
ncbi:unnamed protein product [Periconia digitata]|uniref:Uncharacterized protein n=1 Tax=Periconia digitata TaxID=1303443 RepID=A0A9W4UTZ8_9PLEO|nr:unnamed protein product [Periconia digitata]